MTVIVIRDGVIAADSATFMGDIIVTKDTDKIHRFPDGSLVACTGVRPDISLFLKWGDEGFRPAEKPAAVEPGDFGAAMLSRDGMFKFDHKFNRYEAAVPYVVEGCHAEMLIGCLMMGASAERAVQVAIDCGCYAGGHVTSARLLPLAVAAE